MKKLIVYMALILVSIALLSCYWISGNAVANVTLNLSGVSAKGLDDRYARVYLLANNKIYALREGREYVEIQIPGSNPEIRLTLEDIPVGPTYRVWLSIGWEQGGGWFLTDYWAESNPFELSPGQETIVPFTEAELFINPVFQPVWDVMGKSLKGVVVDEFSTIITADEETVHSEFSLFSVFNHTDLPTGYTVNSIDLGVDVQNPNNTQAWLNTNLGILPFFDLTFDTNFSSALGPVSVLGSAGREVGGSDAVAWFFREGGLGSVDISSDISLSPATWQWVNLGSAPVYDCLVAYPEDGYFATSEGAFRLPRAFLQDPTPSIEEHKIPLSTPGRVLSWGLIDQSGDGDTLFMGTEKGAWYVQMNSGEFDSAPKLEPGTAGHAIRMMAISDFFPTFKAYLSDSYIFIWNGAASTWSRFPLCAGLPGRTTGMAWFKYVTVAVQTFLVVAGEEGLTYFQVDP